jgi:SAM-dependent methyltransferase
MAPTASTSATAASNEQDQIHRAAAAKMPLPKDGKVRRILDMGCGVGQFTSALKERFPDAEVWGIDVGGPMVRYAHLRASKLGIGANFAQKLAEDTGFPDGHFDIVTSYIMHHEVTAQGTLAIIDEARRVGSRVPGRRLLPALLPARLRHGRHQDAVAPDVRPLVGPSLEQRGLELRIPLGAVQRGDRQARLHRGEGRGTAAAGLRRAALHPHGLSEAARRATRRSPTTTRGGPISAAVSVPDGGRRRETRHAEFGPGLGEARRQRLHARRLVVEQAPDHRRQAPAPPGRHDRCSRWRPPGGRKPQFSATLVITERMRGARARRRAVRRSSRSARSASAADRAA